MTSSHLITITGGGVRGHCHTILLHSMLRGEGGGPLEGDSWGKEHGTGSGGGGERSYEYNTINMTGFKNLNSLAIDYNVYSYLELLEL